MNYIILVEKEGEYIVTRLLYGRKVIYTDVEEITETNILEVLNKAKLVHDKNRADIDYLYNYYKGKQDILNKTKEVRANINNKITENRALEIVDFKKGHVFGEPIQYIQRGEDEGISKEITKVNDYMIEVDKGELDTELAEWMLIGGVGYRMILPNEDWEEDSDESPFKLYTLDPRNTFVVRSNNLDQKIVMGVVYSVKEDNSIVYTVYTKDKYFKIQSDKVVDCDDHVLKVPPLIEYRTGNSRMGCFETVISLLDAINNLQSNRLDDIEQTVNSFLAIFGSDMDEETYKKIQEWKTLILPDGADAKYLNATLQQSDIQSLKDDLYQTILTITGLPNRNGGSSTSDTGAAVQLRDGWESAEAQAKNMEKAFKKSERESLKLILRILRDMGGTTLKLRNIDIKFARRYTDNILTKAQTLTQLLDDGIHPSIAIATCGIWNDPTDVALQSKPYLSKWEVEDEVDVLPEN